MAQGGRSAGLSGVEARAPMLRTRLRVGIAGIAVAAVSLLYALWMVVHIGGERATVWFDDLGEMLAALVAAGCCAVAAKRATPWSRRGWRLMALSALSWGLGEAIWSWYELLQGRLAPFPSLADAGYLLAVPPEIAAVVCFAGACTATQRLRSFLDGLVIAAALTSVSWATVLGAVYRAGGTGPLATALGLAYPISDVVVLTMLLVLASRASRRDRLPLLLLAGGLGSAALADSTFAYLTATTSFASGNPIDTGWVLGYLLIALAALRSAAVPLARVADEAPHLSLGRRLLPYVPAVAAAMVALVEVARVGSVSPFSFITLLVLVVLIIARQVLTLRENTELVQNLGARDRQIRHQAQHDPLTDLGNRALLRDRLGELLACRGPDDGPLAVLKIDLDDLEMVRGTLGPDAGDRLVIAEARRLTTCLRPADTAARTAENRFTVVLADVGGNDRLSAVTERLYEVLSQPADVGGGVGITPAVSIGVALAVPSDDVAPDELLRQAALAVNAARGAGRGVVGVCEPSLQVTLQGGGGIEPNGRVAAPPGLCGEDRVRQWLARELHDDAIQSLTTMLLDMEELRRQAPDDLGGTRLQGFQGSIRAVIGGLRRVVGELRDQSGEDHTLVDDVTALLFRFGGRTGIQGELTVSPAWPRNLSTHLAANLRRIVEEALRNVALHSRAERVVVSLDAREEHLTLTVSDDGRGFEGRDDRPAAGCGMLGMRERAMLIGGELEVTSLPGTGTTVRGTFDARTDTKSA